MLLAQLYSCLLHIYATALWRELSLYLCKFKSHFFTFRSVSRSDSQLFGPVNYNSSLGSKSTGARLLTTYISSGYVASWHQLSRDSQPGAHPLLLGTLEGDIIGIA